MRAINRSSSSLISYYFQNCIHAKILLFMLVCFLASSLSSCAHNFPEEVFLEPHGAVERTAYTLGPGDKIRVMVYEHQDLSGSYNIDDSGRISMPLIRGIHAKGLTLPELEDRISDELARNFIVNPKVSIDIEELRPFCILGEVRNPGCFNHIHGMNTAQAVAIAGGFTYRAYKDKFAITREDGQKVAGSADTPIYGGDTIEVYERYF